MARVYGETTGRVFDLGAVLARGGCGVVYLVPGGRLVCKIPDPAMVNLDEAIERIRHFRQNPIGWPAVDDLEVVLEAVHGRPVGFVMKQVHNAHVLHAFLEEGRRQQAGIVADHADLVRLGARLCEGVAAFHKKGVLIADFHGKQVLVDANGDIVILEPDNLEIGLRINGIYRHLRSGVGVYDYAPPEFQGKDFGGLDRTAYSDRWALAVLVWQLIKGGAFPHQVRSTGQPVFPTDLVRDGVFPHDPQAKLPPGVTPVDDKPEFARLPRPIQDLFLRCFAKGATDPLERPRPEEWVAALEDYAESRDRATWHGRLPRLGRLLHRYGAAVLAVLLLLALLLAEMELPRFRWASLFPTKAVQHKTPFKNPPPLWRDDP